MSRFGVRIGWRKYLYECTPFGYVNLCYDYYPSFWATWGAWVGCAGHFVFVALA